jgi:signal peptidase II
MPKNAWWFVLVAVAVVLVDQWTKFLVLDRLTTAFDEKGASLGAFYGGAPEVPEGMFHFRAKQSVTLSDSFFRLSYAENPGAAFGLFSRVPPKLRGPLFHVVSLGAVVLISWYITRLTGAKNEVFAKWGLPLVLGGAIGNYVDRLARGFVVDFLDAHWFDKASWPAFNVADSAIVVGVGLLLIDSFVRKEAKPAAKKVLA